MSGQPATSARTGPVILVIDDHEDTVQLISEFLRWHGAHPVGASSASVARDILAGLCIDAVVTDYAMPGTDGVTFVREIRSRAALAGVPVVMVSGQASEDVVREASTLGAEYLPKPVDLEALVTSLRAALGQRSFGFGDPSPGSGRRAPT